MYYAIYCEDQADTIEKRRHVRPEHLKRVEQLKAEDRLLLAGPLFNGDSEDPLPDGFHGSLIIAKFDNLEAAKTWANADPYVAANIYGRIHVIPFKPVII